MPMSMRLPAFNVLVLLSGALLALAGCAAPATPAHPDGSGLPAKGSQAGSDPDLGAAQGAPPADPRPAEAPARTYAINFHWEAYHQVPVQRPYCNPSAPYVCEVYYQGTVYNTGDVNGTGQFFGQLHPDPGHLGGYGHEVYFFTGQVKGCGQGSFEYTWDGWLGADPTGPGLRLHADYAYVNGTASTGLGGLVDFHGTTDSTTMGVGDVIGEITCR